MTNLINSKFSNFLWFQLSSMFPYFIAKVNIITSKTKKNDRLMSLHAAVRGLKILFAQTKPQIKKTQKTLFALEADMSAQKTHN